MITIFSAPKPFDNEHIAKIQHNAIRSWVKIGDEVEVLLLGEEPGLEQVAGELDLPLIPVSSRAPSGAPMIDELFELAREAARFSILTYVNADIILLDDFLPSVKAVLDNFSEFLMVGKRWDINIHERLNFDGPWIEALRQRLKEHGRRHPPTGSDYFVYSRGQFRDMPEFALGRAGWDNWMMYKARHDGWPLIDASDAITAVHQEHDYAHLPGGEPHYRHPESTNNIKVAGGYETMFRLRDANWLLTAGELRRKKIGEWEWPRKIEADLIAVLGVGYPARLTRMAFHPRDSISYLRQKYSPSGPERRNGSSDREVPS
jgi:hypothetical protein